MYFACAHGHFGCPFLGLSSNDCVQHLTSCPYEAVKETLQSFQAQLKEKDSMKEEIETLRKQLGEKDGHIIEFAKQLSQRDDRIAQMERDLK